MEFYVPSAYDDLVSAERSREGALVVREGADDVDDVRECVERATRALCDADAEVLVRDEDVFADVFVLCRCVIVRVSSRCAVGLGVDAMCLLVFARASER
jgi:hypothetical protein